MKKVIYHLLSVVGWFCFVFVISCYPRPASESELRYMEQHPDEYPVLQMINQACEFLSTKLQTDGLPGLKKNERVTMTPEKSEVIGKGYTIPIRFSFADIPADSPEDRLRDTFAEEERERKEIGWEKQVEIKGRKRKVQFPFKVTVKVLREVEPNAYYFYTVIKKNKDVQWALTEAYKTDSTGKVLCNFETNE